MNLSNSNSSGTGHPHASGSAMGSRTGSFAGGAGPENTPPAHRGMTMDVASGGPRPPAHPALKWLAFAGWGTFVAEWLLMLLFLANIVGGANPRPVEAAPRAAAPTTSVTTNNNPQPVKVAPRVTSTPAAVAQAHVLGLQPSPGHTVIVLDAVEKSTAWFTRGKNNLKAGLSRPGPTGATFSIAVINNNSGRGLIEQPVTYGPAAAATLNRALDSLHISGTKGFGKGFDAAARMAPDQIIFITSRDTKWAAAIPFLESKLLINGKKTRLHVVQVNDAEVSELKSFVTGSNGGRYRLAKPNSF